jgi:non-ribosomal peptide synthetase component F
MLAALTLILQRYTGQDDLAVGTDVANRTSADTEDVIGFFANQLVLRIRMDDHLTVTELLRRTKSVCLGAYEHQDLPFQQLVSMLGRDRDSSHSPLFQVKLGYLQFSPEQLDLPGCTVTLMPTEGTAKFDIEVTSWPTADGLVEGSLEYATDLFVPETMRRMSDHLAEAVAAMAADDTAKVLHVPLSGAGGDVTAVNQQDMFDFERPSASQP